MHVSPGYVSSKAPPWDVGDARRLLICGVNWLGDSLMTLPAWGAFQRRYPGTHVTLLVKPALRPLWELCGTPGALRTLTPGVLGTFSTGFLLRREHFDAAVIFPNSFRSAFIPWIAGIPRRFGFSGHGRSVMLSQASRWPRVGTERRHQAYEYADLLGVPLTPDDLQPPFIKIEDQGVSLARQKFVPDGVSLRPIFALMPGAARGPSKRWPIRYFAEIGRRMAASYSGRILVLGSTSDKTIGAEVASMIGIDAIDLTGQTSLAELAALMQSCELIVANDSGGMHLAAALGVPVAGIFGATDPRVTGPLGCTSRAVKSPGSEGVRDVARDSALARDALERLTPDHVWNVVEEMMLKRRGTQG